MKAPISSVPGAGRWWLSVAFSPIMRNISTPCFLYVRCPFLSNAAIKSLTEMSFTNVAPSDGAFHVYVDVSDVISKLAGLAIMYVSSTHLL